MKKNKYVYAAVLFALITVGCQKFLDQKPNTSLNIPSTLADFQALIDYYPIMNNIEPCSGEISSDDYYLFDADYTSIAQDNFKRLYTWQKDNLFPAASNEWLSTYQAGIYVQYHPGQYRQSHR